MCSQKAGRKRSDRSQSLRRRAATLQSLLLSYRSPQTRHDRHRPPRAHKRSAPFGRRQERDGAGPRSAQTSPDMASHRRQNGPNGCRGRRQARRSQARVFRHGQRAGMSGVVQRLLTCVFRKGRSRLVGRSDRGIIRQRLNFNRQSRQNCANLVELAGVSGGEKQSQGSGLKAQGSRITGLGTLPARRGLQIALLSRARSS